MLMLTGKLVSCYCSLYADAVPMLCRKQLQHGHQHSSAGTQVHDQLDEDMHVRMAVMEGATHMGQQAQQLCENGLRIALQDWWQQPATYVVPWLTREWHWLSAS